MSGGLDSSMAAKILKDKGYDIIGLFMSFGVNDKEDDMNRARMVCSELGINLYPVDLSFEFKKRVKDYFLNSYKKGLTPNPCVACNKFLKFGELLKMAKGLGAEYLATGHYVRIEKEDEEYKIYRPVDRSKDQTYFLYTLTQEQLKHLLFPLSGKKKEDIRKQAESLGLPYIKKESQDVCFLPDDHNIYLKDNLELKPGDIVTLEGEKVGEHKGLPLYTIGQRKGIEIGGDGPFYAVKMDHGRNILYVTRDGNDDDLYKKELIAKEVNWIAGQEPKLPLKCSAMIRYGHKDQPCIVKRANKGYLVEFQEPQRAITPGQNVSFYKKEQLLGGGIIV